MLDKKILDAMRYRFYEEFDALSEKDDYIQRMKADAFALIGSMAPNDSRLETDVEDAITGIVTSASLLGFFIGLRTGADMIKSLTNSQFPECILAAYGELK